MFMSLINRMSVNFIIFCHLFVLMKFLDKSYGLIFSVKSPASLKGNSSILHVVTDDVDAAFAKALEAGAKSVEEVADQPWGVRYGKVIDPFGFVWSFGTPLKQVQQPVAQEGENAPLAEEPSKDQ